MPDKDIFNRLAEPGWASPLRRLYGRAEPAEVGQISLKALRRTLKKRGGLPGGREVCSILERCSRGILGCGEAWNLVHAICMRTHHYLYACVAERAAQRLIREMHQGVVHPNIPDRFAREFCEDLLRHHLEKGAPQLLDRRFESHSELTSFLIQCFTEIRPDLERIAVELSLDPSGRALKQPPSTRRRIRKSTVELLDEPI